MHESESQKVPDVSRRYVIGGLGATILGLLVGPKLFGNDRVAAQTDSSQLSELTANPEIQAELPVPEIVQVGSIGELEIYFRSFDAQVLGEGKTVADYSEEEIRQIRKDKLLHQGPFTTTIVVGRACWEYMQEQAVRLGTDDPTTWMVGTHILWNHLCSIGQLPAQDAIKRIVIVDDPQFEDTTMQYLNSQGFADSGPWRTHWVNNDPNLAFMEPLDTDHVMIYSNKFATDSYFENLPWPVQVTFTYQGRTYSITTSFGDLHEWFGHTKGKSDTAGMWPDYYWYNRIAIKQALAEHGIELSQSSFFWDPQSLMNQWNWTHTRVTGADTAYVQIRKRFLPDYGGVHAEGWNHITYPSDEWNFGLFEVLHPAGYGIKLMDSNQKLMTSWLVKNVATMYWDAGPDLVTEHTPRFEGEQNDFLLLNREPDAEDIQNCNAMLLLDTNDRVQLFIPRPLLVLFASLNADRFDERLDITINVNQNRVVADLGTWNQPSGDFCIHSFLGKIPEHYDFENSDVIAWCEMQIPPTEDGETTVTFVWTNNMDYDMYDAPPLLDKQIFLPVIITNSSQQSPGLSELSVLDSVSIKPDETFSDQEAHDLLLSKQDAESLEIHLNSVGVEQE